MLRLAIIFAVLALVAGVLGFWALAGVAGEIAKWLFIAFVLVVVGALVLGYTVWRRVT